MGKLSGKLEATANKASDLVKEGRKRSTSRDPSIAGTVSEMADDDEEGAEQALPPEKEKSKTKMKLINSYGNKIEITSAKQKEPHAQFLKLLT